MPGREILVPAGSDDVVAYLSETDEAELRGIGRRAQERMLADHTAQRRAQHFEQYVSRVGSVSAVPLREPAIAV